MKRNDQAVATSSKIRFNQDSSSDDEGENEIEQELADVTFEELQRARSDGSDTICRKQKAGKRGGRENKNRPMEISCKRPVSRFREVIQAPKRVVRDPRFDSLSGTFDEQGFKKRYSFLYEDILPAERENLKRQIDKVKNTELKYEMEGHIAQIDKLVKPAVTLTKRTEKDILAEHKKREREAAMKGKQPYFLKKSEVRKQKLIEKYNELKASGKLDSFIQKKRRKNAAKDHRYVPYRRPTEQGS